MKSGRDNENEGHGRTGAPGASRIPFTENLLTWYDQHRRDLPWRRTKDPYAIWVSEAMLQQTQVKTVIGYYDRFMARFPDVYALAGADEDEILRYWEGLGYYSRVRNLWRGAQIVVQEHGGRLPASPEALRRLPGVGDYMVGAIASIAFELPEPAVDGNVLRVLARYGADSADVTRSVTKRRFAEIVTGLMPPVRRGDFTQALMELGALICTPQSPQCGSCPLSADCRGQNEPGRFPVKTVKKQIPTYHWAALVLSRDGQCLIRKRPGPGLLAGLWEFPLIEPGEVPPCAQHLGRISHTFSHRHWVVDVYAEDFGSGQPEQAGACWTCSGDTKTGIWVAREELGNYPMPVVQHKIGKLAGITALSAG